MSLKVQELIKRIRACKTAEEERSVINKESAEMRNLSKESLTNTVKKRNLLKCIYMHMMGYSTTFIQVSTINLLASSNFTEKRIAYLCLGLLLDEKSEVLLLSTHAIKKDLDSSNLSIVALALNAIGEACTADMCRELASEVGKLMGSSFVYLKKKAAIACTKILKKCPELTDTFIDQLYSYFEYKNHGVLLAGCALANEIFKIDPSHIKKFTKYTGVLVRLLKNLITSNYSSEFDVNGVTDPFLQCQMLSVLKNFGKGNKEISDEMKDIISDISTSSESNKLTSNAVQYELVKTIIGIESDTSMKSLASNILGRLLQSKDNNYKYISLNTLREVVRTDMPSVQKHKNIILDCLKDSDISICRRALELTYLIINQSNVKQIVKELLSFLLIAADEFKLELTTRITQCIISFGPSVKWQIDNLIKMLCMSGNFFSEDSVSSIINLIISNDEIKIYSVHKLFIAFKNYYNQEALAKVAVYVIGEYGDLLVNNCVIGPNDEKIIVRENDVMEIFRNVENAKYSNSAVYEFLMNCYIKLSTKFSEENAKLLKQYIKDETTSFYFEVQQRAAEYAAFDQVVNESMKSQLTRNIPCSKTHVIRQIDVIVPEDYEDGDKSDSSELDQQLLIKYSSDYSHIRDNSNALIGNLNSNQTKLEAVNILDDLKTLFVGNNSGENLGEISNNNINFHSNFTGVTFPEIMNLSTSPQIQSNTTSDNLSYNQNSNNILTRNEINPPYYYTSNPNAFLTNPLIDLSVSSPIQMNNMNIPTTLSDDLTKIKEFYRNQYISLSYTSKLNSDNSYSGYFYVSNISNHFLSNVNMKFMVLTFLTFKVMSSSGINLEPLQKNGIKKEYHLVSNKPEKKIIIKIKFSFNLENKEISETITLDDFN